MLLLCRQVYSSECLCLVHPSDSGSVGWSDVSGGPEPGGGEAGAGKSDLPD